jgi:hypothetical protein
MKKTVSLLIAVIILALSSVPAMAAISPTASKEYKIVVHNNKGGTGTYTTKIDKDGKHATVTAHPKKGYEFVKWTSKGKYKLIKGSLNDKELKILLQGDVEFTPIFKKIGSKSATPQTPVKRNQSPVSPKTGDSSVFFIFGGLLAAAMFTAVGIKLAVSVKK